jgi:sodium transport system permease protein
MASANPEFRISLDFVSLLWVIPMLLPLAGLFSALLLTIALFARSYREAQSYLSPLMIVAILPAMVSMVPGVEPSLKLALVPVINVALMLKEVIIGSCDPLIMTITLISTLIYAGLGIWVAFRQFQRESVLFRV